jgi:hypothetical protein
VEVLCSLIGKKAAGWDQMPQNMVKIRKSVPMDGNSKQFYCNLLNKINIIINKNMAVFVFIFRDEE